MTKKKVVKKTTTTTVVTEEVVASKTQIVCGLDASSSMNSIIDEAYEEFKESINFMMDLINSLMIRKNLVMKHL